jgi:hypothetical protein
MTQVFHVPRFDLLPSVITDIHSPAKAKKYDTMPPGLYCNEILALNMGRDERNSDLFLLVYIINFQCIVQILKNIFCIGEVGVW